MTHRAPDFIRDKLCSDKGKHYYRVKSINAACKGCALHSDLAVPPCWERVDCGHEDGNVHTILINTDESSVGKYVIERLTHESNKP